MTPLFPFGFGLACTEFSYGGLRLSAREMGPDDMLGVSVDVTNTGQYAGKEVVQLYIRDVTASLQRPGKELKAFAKVQLEPGERKAVTFTLAPDALAYYDDLQHAWVAEAGEFEVLTGSSSQDIRATFVLTTSSSFGERPSCPGADQNRWQPVGTTWCIAVCQQHDAVAHRRLPVAFHPTVIRLASRDFVKPSCQ